MCVLIADSRREPFPLIVRQWAMLRGLKCVFMDLAAADFGAEDTGCGALLATSFQTLAALGSQELRSLKAAVWRGATLYVRGIPPAQPCSLAPFRSVALPVVGAAW